MNTSAGRLHTLILRGKQIAGPGRDRWAKLFQINPDNIPEVFRLTAEMQLLPRQVAHDLRKVDGINHTLYLSWVERVGRVLQIENFAMDVAGTLSQIDQNELSLIEICDDHLYRLHREPLLDKSKLDSIRKDAETLVAQIRGADIPEDLKNFLIKHLDIVVSAIASYELLGASAIVDGIERTFGMAVVKPKLAEAANASDYGRKTIALLSIFVLLHESGERAYQLAESASGAVQRLLEISDRPPNGR